MIEVILLKTKSGELVQGVKVPKFEPRAEVIMWGERYFIFHTLINGVIPEYREALCYVATDRIDVEEETKR